MNEFSNFLQTLIQTLSYHTNIHICIHDISGILDNEILRVGRKNGIHSALICDCFKSSHKGLIRCLSCKYYANEKAKEEKKPFVGKCINGLTEVVQPVVINHKVMCVIYIGNIITDREFFLKQLPHFCRKSDLSKELILDHLKHVHFADDVQVFVDMARLISRNIIFAYEKFKLTGTMELHWAVVSFQNYITSHFNNDLNLNTLAKLYYLNPKYIGRVFKKQTGLSFSQYLNQTRLKEACKLLEDTDYSVIDISLSCGYESSNYFNRVFKQEYQVTPLEYRRLHRKDN